MGSPRPRPSNSQMHMVTQKSYSYEFGVDGCYCGYAGCLKLCSGTLGVNSSEDDRAKGTLNPKS